MNISFMQAIAREEGFYVPGTRATRNNNPGNIVFHSWLAKFGAVLETVPAGEKARFAAFPDPESGFAAMRDLLAAGYCGLTVAQALNKWAPPSDGNDTSRYTANVTRWTGLAADTALTPELLDTIHAA